MQTGPLKPSGYLGRIVDGKLAHALDLFGSVIVGAGEYARYDEQGDAYIIPLTALGA